jgi:hypothetical protein
MTPKADIMESAFKQRQDAPRFSEPLAGGYFYCPKRRHLVKEDSQILHDSTDDPTPRRICRDCFNRLVNRARWRER